MAQTLWKLVGSFQNETPRFQSTRDGSETPEIGHNGAALLWIVPKCNGLVPTQQNGPEDGNWIGIWKRWTDMDKVVDYMAQSHFNGYALTIKSRPTFQPAGMRLLCIIAAEFYNFCHLTYKFCTIISCLMFVMSPRPSATEAEVSSLSTPLRSSAVNNCIVSSTTTLRGC